MLLRLTASLMFVAAGGLAGAHFSYKLSKRREVCREIDCLLRSCEVLIRCNAMNVYDIFSRLRNNAELSSLEFLRELPLTYTEGGNFHIQWQRALDSQAFPDEEKQLLEEFGGVLGTSDIQGQKAAIESLSERVRGLEKRRSELCLQKCRLYRSIGVLFGVMAGILVI